MAEILLVAAVAYVAKRLFDGARPRARHRHERGGALPWRLLLAACLAVLVLAYVADFGLPAQGELHRPTTEPEEVRP